MKKQVKVSKDKVIKMYCNSCGKSMFVENDMLKEGGFSTSFSWGYFSNKDGTTHSFDLCEKCYDEIVSKFVIPIDKEEYLELI